MDEQMNMVEILSEELGEKELKIMALEKKLKEQENITKKFMKDTLIKDIKSSECFIEDEYEIDIELKDIWEDIIEDMNDQDWNEDDHHCELYMYNNEAHNPIGTPEWIINARFRECIECGDCGSDEICTDLTWHVGPDPDCGGYWCKDCRETYFIE